MARAFVLGLNARAALAILLVALSVAYALLTGAAAAGLRDASATLEPALLLPDQGLALPGLEPFPAGLASQDALILKHASWRNLTLGTMRPWPYAQEAVPGLYARAPRDTLAELGLPVGEPSAHEFAPWDWVLVPPEAFEGIFPQLAGKATMAKARAGTPAPALLALPIPAAGVFYAEGAAQVFRSVQLVVAAMALVVAVLAGGVLRLEVLARERDLATLEALGSARAARRAVVQRALFLVGLGVLSGVGAGFLVTRVGARALGSEALRFDPGFALGTAFVALAAGFAAGALGGLAGLRAPLGQRLGQRGPPARPFRAPVRFLLVTPRLIPSVLAAALVVATVTSVVLAAASVPFAIFEPGEGVQVVGQASGNPFRGSADRFLGEHATLLPGINASSPETVAPTVVKGKPVVVRGVALAGWQALDAPQLLEGRWPALPGEATAGSRAARVLGLHPGDEVLVPGAYRATLRWMRIVGIHEGAGLADDELVTDLDTAGDLAGLPPNQVHMIRVEATREAVEQALAGPRVLVTNLTVVPPKPVPLTQALARVTLLNLGSAEEARLLEVRANGILEASSVARVPARGQRVVEIPFRVPDAAVLEVEVNPTLRLDTGEAQLLLVAPESIAANSSFRVRVTDRAGNAVEGAVVNAGTQEAITDRDGSAELLAGEPRALVLTARLRAQEGGRVVYVVEPEWALSPKLQVQHAVVRSAAVLNETHVQYNVTLTLTNLGGAPFDGEVEALSEGLNVGSAALRLGIRQQATIDLEAKAPRDAASLDVLGYTIALPEPRDPEIPREQRPRTVEQVLAEKRAALEQLRGARELSGRAFLEDVFAALEPTVVLVVLATFLHAGAGVSVAVLREVRERGEVLQVLGHLGATPDQISARAARDALLAALPGLAAGAGAGLLALAALQPWGFPAAFGHTIPVSLDAAFFLRIVGALGLVALLSAAWAAKLPPGEPARQAAGKPLPELLGGSG